MPTDLLTWPQQLSKAGVAGSGRFELGHEPYFIVEVNGATLVNLKAREAHGMMVAVGKPTYDAIIYRADVEGGIGIIPTLNLSLGGREAALMTKQQFPKGAPIKIYGGYVDVNGPYNKRLLFDGEVTKAKQVPAFPIEVIIHCQGYSGRLNQPYSPKAPEQIADPVEFIKQRLANRGLTSNFMRNPTNVSTDNVNVDDLAEKRETLLDYINAFCESHGLYWTDAGDKTIMFHFPENRVSYLNQPPINWEFRQNGNVKEPDIAAPLQQWDIAVAFADAPSKVSFVWRKPRSNVVEKEVVEVPVPGGNPELPGKTYLIKAKTRAQAEELGKALVDDVLWQTVSGPWSTGSIGIPVLPFDYITATRGPVGLTEIYDRAMVVNAFHHTFDAQGWHSKGNVRGVYAG